MTPLMLFLALSLVVGALLYFLLKSTTADFANLARSFPGVQAGFESPGVAVLRVDCALLSLDQRARLVHRLLRSRLPPLDLTLHNGDDASFRAFARLPRIDRLSLPNSRVGDEALPLLSRPDRIEVLNAEGSPVTDEGARWLAGHAHSLESLNLADTQVSDRALQHLERCAGLSFLNLSGTHITDRGLRHLLALPQLYSLSLDRTGISPEGVRALIGHPTLADISLEFTLVTPADLPGLREAFSRAGRSVDLWASSPGEAEDRR